MAKQLRELDPTEVTTVQISIPLTLTTLGTIVCMLQMPIGYKMEEIIKGGR